MLSKTLKPSSMEALSRLSSSRRSHLESASYLTLSRIFSLCRDLPLKPQNPNPDATLVSVADEKQTSDACAFENPKFDGAAQALQLAVEKIDSLNELEIDASTNDERLDLMVSDLSLLVGAPCDQMHSGSGEFGPNEQKRNEKDNTMSLVGELNGEKDQNQRIEVDNSSIYKVDTGNDAVLDSRCQEMASGKEIDQSGEEDRLKDNTLNKTIISELVNANMEQSQKKMEKTQLEPPNEISNLGNSYQDHLNSSIEEGEITDVAQDRDGDSYLDNNDELLIDDETEEDWVNKRSDEKLATREDITGSKHQKLVSQSQGVEPSEKANEVGKKRKRGVLSVERKAKKKKAYRIKRAKKALKDGVKRLRLPPPVIKEKEKQICKFYLLGKCQQGGQCKFSHDVTPVTKSKACSHFARGECLKGDECPYDHELSKYLCHKFVSEGVCIRGANCKFSHDVQNTEGVSVQTKEPGKEFSEKSDVKKQINESQKFSIAKCTPLSTVNHPKPVSEKSIEVPVRVPKGIRFLSFGADTEQEKHSDAKPITRQNPLLMEKNLMNIPNEGKEKLVSEAAGVSGSGDLSEASKILQEFLFDL